MEEKNSNNKTNEVFTGTMLSKTLAALLKRFWIIIAVALVFGLFFYTVAKVLYIEVFESNTVIALTTSTFVNALDENGNQIKVVSQQKIFDENDANKYLVLLRSDFIVENIMNETGSNYGKTEVKESLSIDKASTSGIFNVTVSSKNDAFCNTAIGVVNREFPGYLKSFDPSLGVVVINDPQQPVVSNKSDPLKMAFLGFLAGALLVAAVIYISELIRDTIKSIDDIRYRLNIKVLGTMPTIEHYTRMFSNKKLMRCPILNNENKVSFSFVESFKTIRTKIENSSNGDGHNVLAVTSTFENEGKTTVAVNLACVLSQKGKSVLMIDCDLRKPSVLRMVGVREDGKRGVIQIVRKESTCADSIKYVKSLGFFVLPSGGTTNKSTEIVGTDEFKNILDQVRGEFDYVIIDTPPAHVVADCLVIAPNVDALIFAIRTDYAKTKDIISTIEELESANVDIIGSVLTMTDESSSNSYFSGWGGSSYYRRRKGYYDGYYTAKPQSNPGLGGKNTQP